jgi:hypothetical protein
VNKADEYSFSLPRLWIVVFLLCLLDLTLLSGFLTGMPRLGLLLGWMPRSVARGIVLYGPFVLAAAWLMVVTIAVRFHGWRGLWLLVTGLLILPATYLHWSLVWNCAVHGQCL